MRLHQICARLKYGDAITNQVMRIHEAASSWGWESHIYATAHDDIMKPVNEELPTYRKHYRKNRDDLLVYHYSIYDKNHVFYDESLNRRVFYYHNITPPQFFQPYDSFMAEYCKLGRDLIPRFRNCDFAVSDSEYNRRELLEAGTGGPTSSSWGGWSPTKGWKTWWIYSPITIIASTPIRAFSWWGPPWSPGITGISSGASPR